MGEINRIEGRRAFGLDPIGYDRSRPEYPPEIYQLLEGCCGLRVGARVFEIGPGTGLATKRLLELGADPLLVVEPDERLANYLKIALGEASKRVEVKVASFEDVILPPGAFDLGVAATAFHWLDQRTSLQKIAHLLCPGGWWAMWWTVFGDPSRPDNFYGAVAHLFRNLDRSPSSGSGERPPFALDVDARIADLSSTGKFEKIENQMFRTSEVFQTAKLLELHTTFSEISRLDPTDRNRLLEKLAEIADKQFNGRVEKPIVTSIYIAQRKLI
jgi:SAM-dependent methyltransferase